MSRGVARRRRLVEAGLQAASLGLAPGRGDRWRARLAGKAAPPPPRLDQLAAWPRWPRFEAAAQDRVLAAVATVAGRDALVREIDGARLRGYAAVLGEDLLEEVLALPAGGSHPLPSPDKAVAAGRLIVRQALPAELARASNIEPIADPRAAAWVATAEDLVVQHGEAA